MSDTALPGHSQLALPLFLARESKYLWALFALFTTIVASGCS